MIVEITVIRLSERSMNNRNKENTINIVLQSFCYFKSIIASIRQFKNIYIENHYKKEQLSD